jgi:hypothetical protein
VLIAMGFVLVGIIIYRRKRVKERGPEIISVVTPANPQSTQSTQSTQPTQRAQRAQRRQRGVWRAEEPSLGLPSYTIQPTRGELSLGTGRKRSEEEEYELAETVTNPEPASGETAEPSTTLREAVASQEVPQTAAKPPESLPPYIPPEPDVVADGQSVSRIESHRSQNSRRISANTRPS